MNKSDSNIIDSHSAKNRQSIEIMDNSCFSELKRFKVESGEAILHFQPALDMANDVLWDLNMKTNHLYLSPNVIKLFPIKHSEELKAEEIWDNMIFENDRNRLINEFIPLINGLSDDFTVESRVKSNSEAIKWIKVRGKVLTRSTDGSPDRLTGTCADITSFKKIDEELKIKHKLFKSYFDDNPIGLVISTFNDSWMEINKELCRLLDYEKEELLGKPWTNVMHSDDIPATLKLIQEANDGKIDRFQIKARLLRKDGEALPVIVTSMCVRNEDKSIQQFLTTIINNTEYSKIEEEIRYERIVLSTLIDSLPISIYIIDNEGRKIISNKYDLEIIGNMNLTDVLGKTDRELFPGEVGERGHNDNMFVVNNNVAIRNKLENFFDQNGQQRWLLTNKIPLFDQNHQTSGLIGYGIDITDLRNLQQKIKDSEDYYRTLVNISPDGIVVTDQEGRITFSSKKTLEILGLSDKETLIGSSIFSWVAPESLDLAVKNFMFVLDGVNATQTSEYICYKSDKSKFWIELSFAPISDSKGTSIGLMILCRDITARKKIEEELILAKNKAEESDILKTALLRNISHEIRTPLNGVLGFSELLRESSLNREELVIYIDAIQQSSHQLLSIINDLIDISSIEAKIIKQQKSIIDLNDLLRDIQSKFRFEASSKNLTLTLTEGLSHDKAQIIADKTKLKQIICNLLSNAIKFTNTGMVSFGYSQNDSFLEFYVSDTGIGIEHKYYSKIFETFYQIENGPSKRFEGTGLGLSICKAYIKLMGGKIWLTSQINAGSTFFFTIPYDKREYAV